MSDAGGGRMVVGRGALETESLLLAALDPLLDELGERPELLSRPVLVVVPSNSLRDHLLDRLLRHRGRAIAGLAVTTLYRLALETLAEAGGPAPTGHDLFEILLRREAQREPALSSQLDDLADGYTTVGATVRDLLDAGFTTDHLEPVVEQIQDLAGREGWRETAACAESLCIAAARALAGAAAAGVAAPGELFARAAEAVAAGHGPAHVARAVWIHGFADATGTATDLLATLIRHADARIVLDDPPDPADPGRSDPGVAFSADFRARLGLPAAAARPPAPGQLAEIGMVRAPGAHGEAREIARRIRALLDGGARPESILVVARDLAPFAVPLRVHFRRLGVPFSALGAATPAGRTARRVAALRALLDLGPALPADRWLDLIGADRNLDLRVGLRTLGLARLADVAALDPETAAPEGRLALPLRHGLELRGDEEGEAPEPEPDDGLDERARTGKWIAPRHWLPGATLAEAVARARRLVDLLAGWPELDALARHAARVRTLVAHHLGWSAEDDRAELDATVAALAAEAPPAIAVTRTEIALLLRRRLAVAARRPLGGRGGGVQVLNAIEARARTAEHLFLLGLNRDTFPRTIREDPLIPDAFRTAMRVTLEALPRKLSGYDEERYLFAQLLSAAPRVTVSWQAFDDDGRTAPPSPLLERVLLATGRTSEQVPRCDGPFTAVVLDQAPRPLLEHAVVAGLRGRGEAFAATFAEAAGALAPVTVATGPRLAVLDELEPPPGDPRHRELGPLFGFVGPVAGNQAAVPVTTLEGLARCPWQAFLRNVLRLEPPRDPLETVAALDAQTVGQTVHAVLEAIATRAGVPAEVSLDTSLAGPARPVPWPGPTALDALVDETASAIACAAGIPRLAGPLAAQAARLLAVAAGLDWADRAPAMLGVEVTGGIELSGSDGRTRVVTFRADRVDDGEDGPALSDYKSGRPLSSAKTDATRARHLVAQIAAGTRLQVPLYALATGGVGRYVFLGRPDDPGLTREMRLAPVAAGDAESIEAAQEALRITLAAWSAGAFLPRLLDAKLEKSSPACQWCEVRDACLQHDTTSRRRLERWVTTVVDSRPPVPVTAAREVWELPARRDA